MERISLKKPVFEFHIARSVRDYYGFPHTLYAQSGNVVFPNVYAVRLFAEKMNQHRDLVRYPEQVIKTGQLNAMGLIDEILHYVADQYKKKNNEDIFEAALIWLEKSLGEKATRELLQTFITEFPPLDVYLNTKPPAQYLKSKSAGISNRTIALEELMLFHLANSNPAFSPFRELFDDTELGKTSQYRKAAEQLHAFFKTVPFFGPDNQDLFEMLRTPAVRFPHSLFQQLEFIRTRWGYLLSDYILKLFGSLDLIKEEEKPAFTGPGPTVIPDFRALGIMDEDHERFSADLDWMPKVVMIAKSTYVWLDQLSKKYSRRLATLDQIPDEELDILARRGFTGLWLIGLWERSDVSRKIKQICGNPEAISSAYSLYDYIIAQDLGGEAALSDLRQRAWQRGIRLASDMVPNHTGLYSRWVVEHPDWYVQCRHQVYPSYKFNGPNLSDDGRISLFIEDGYWNRSDAAVLFKRVDNHSGDTRYIYHGNDGTSMPWNDTAQLNYLLPEVREAVIQTIIHVARLFPIIRLDAAMTLTKRHFQRLWFPRPGHGGDIPSRGEFALSSEEFQRLFPVEFWREVVDRVAQEAPDTLLLAEAFWMMEGYFVRTLGMHRVYNSAFMNMLKNEENQKYRQAIRSVMDFNPEIMKRYVNFMNNPDEETAVAQFGKDDKYFGVCTLMVTLPGLPMFGHGQIEGFSEKYGMEYRRSYWDEQEDRYLIERHEREIFPLLKKRYIFSEVRNFVLYDLIDSHGQVNENVFAFSNMSGDERALVLYNNKYDRAAGWIRFSSASARKDDDQFVQYVLGEGLQLPDRHDVYVIFRDQINGLEFLRRSGELHHSGLYVELDGFKYHVFLDFRQVEDNIYGHYRQLYEYLNGRGVPSIDLALKETFLSPLHQPLRDLLGFEVDRLSADAIQTASFEQLADTFLGALKHFSSADGNIDVLKSEISAGFIALVGLKDHLVQPARKRTKYGKLFSQLTERAKTDLSLIYSWNLLHNLGILNDKQFAHILSLTWLDELLLSKIIMQKLRERGYTDSETEQFLLQLKSLIIHQYWLSKALDNLPAALEALFQQPESQKLLQVHRYQELLYFAREPFEQFLLNSFLTGFVSEGIAGRTISDKILIRWLSLLTDVKENAEKAGYRVDMMLR